jgi:hypothetical protein
VGIYKTLEEAASAMVSYDHVIRPSLKSYHKYSKIYALHKHVYQALIKSFEERKNVLEQIYTEDALQSEIKNL